MNKFIRAQAFCKHLLDRDRLAVKAATIIEAILAAYSPRLSAIAQPMPGSETANDQMIQRFLGQVDVKALWLRLFQTDAPFVVGDPAEMSRPQACKFVIRLPMGRPAPPFYEAVGRQVSL